MCGIFHSKRDLGKILCLPLAVFGLIFALFQVGYASWKIVAAVDDYANSEIISFIIHTVVNSIILLFGVVGFIAILSRWSSGVGFLKMSKSCPSQQGLYSSYSGQDYDFHVHL